VLIRFQDFGKDWETEDESTFEGLQWLSPLDLRRFDFLSPGSSYQINRRYRNGSHVQRYYGFQLWKIHETRLELPELRAFWRHFGIDTQNKFEILTALVIS